jgi:hypothetical protein
MVQMPPGSRTVRPSITGLSGCLERPDNGTALAWRDARIEWLILPGTCFSGDPIPGPSPGAAQQDNQGAFTIVTFSCGGYIAQKRDTYYRVNIHRNATDITLWEFYRDGSFWLSKRGPNSAGVPLAGTERGGSTNNSAYAHFDGANYQKADGSWLGWVGVRGWCYVDSEYNLDPTGSGIRSFYVRKRGSPGSTQCQP